MSVLTAGAPPRATLRYQLDTSLARVTPAERAERGKSARAAVPRESHAVFDPPRWQRTAIGLDGKQRDFYVRQLRDWKFSMPIESIVPRGMRLYGELCGWTHKALVDAVASGRIAAEPDL